MSVVLTINGTTYDYPTTGDEEWGPEATDWAVAVTTGMLQKAGGLFQLLAEVDFGTAFGIKSIYFKSRTVNPASTGALRLAQTDGLYWRNAANSGNLGLTLDGSDNLLFNGNPFAGVLGVTDTDSIDLTLLGGNILADLNLSAASASAGSIKVNLSIETDGLLAQLAIASVPVASGSVTGFLSNTDWSTFNAKQAAGSYITALIGDVTASGPGSVAATIANGAVSLAKMANLAANSIIGNNTGSPATPIALTATQATAMLNAFVGDSGSGGTKGEVPAPSAGDAAAGKLLSAGGGWQAPYMPALFKDKKAFDVNGGSTVSLTWTQHDLTVDESSSFQSYATLSSNQITIANGKYSIQASAAFYLSSSCKLRLYNITDSVVICEGGTDTYGPNVAGGDQMTNIMTGIFAITGGPKVIELQYWAASATGGSGLGVANNNSGIDNYYASVMIQKIV